MGGYTLHPSVFGRWRGRGVGIRWIASSAGILKGVTPLQRKCRRMKKLVPEEAITGLIVEMMVQYWEN
ncbi:MAG: hypothetical protein LUO93_07315 [Methanomicrobiales archaeon]|nr:hypothetical protein [Methanomicrobiales archaeon]